MCWQVPATKQASAQIPLTIGKKITTLATLVQLSDGDYQFCSEPESHMSQKGSGICYWFTKSGNQFIGYYGVPNSDIFIDCVSGTVREEKIVGNALAVSFDDSLLPQLKSKKTITWQTLTLRSGKIEYKSPSDYEKLELIRFSEAKLSLKDFYRYSPVKAQGMRSLPSSCSVQEWLLKVST